MSDNVIRVEGLAKEYRIGANEGPYRTVRESLTGLVTAPLRRLTGDHSKKGRCFWALEDVSFTVGRGEVVGVIGRNGAGKSTLLKILSRITPPTKGAITMAGRVGSLLEVGTGFHPELSGRENIFLNGAILGMRRKEIAEKLDDIVAFAEVEAFLDTPIKRYSSGMHVRLAFAVAAHLHPEILLVDEVLAVGDSAFQRKCLGKVDEIARGGRTVLFVSHQMSQIRRLCSRVLWLREGRLEAQGRSDEVIGQYEASLSTKNVCERDPDNRFLAWSLDDGGHTLENTHESVVVHTEINLRERIVNGHFGLAIANDEGQIVAGWAFDDVNLGAGRARLALTLECLPIRPGTYSLQFSLFDRGNNLNGGTVVEIWPALPLLSVNCEHFGHPQERWAGALNIKASLASMT